LKKLMLLAALLAMVIVAAVPAIAQLEQDNEQEADSSEVSQNFSVEGSGDNSTQCVGIQGVGQTGNAQNQTNIFQYASTVDEFEFEEVGGTITASPTNTTSCEDQVNQAASAAA
jgi:uncharacterized protein (UPF0333 family)